MKFKNVLVCTMAILPMFCAIESQAGLADDYNKAMYKKKHNSEGYKNTQKLNDKQKLFLREVMENRAHIQVELCHMDTGSLKQCKDGNQGMGWRLPINNKSKYISNVTVSVEGDDSIIKITASPDFFGENVTLIHDCSVAEGRVDCPISAKSSCLEKGLCSAGVYDVEPDDSVTLREVEYKIK